MSTDAFESKLLAPMLLSEAEPFDDPDYIFELKLDGARCLAYLDERGTELRNKRNKYVSGLYPELASLNRQVRERCVLDGELICMRDGKPDFYELQRRSIMGDSLKISLAAERIPVQFVAYDILYLKDKLVTDLPLTERKRILSETVTEGKGLSVSRYVEGQGVAFFNLAMNRELEGVVAKRKDSRYRPGERSRDWLKIKVLKEEDLVICGYLPSDDGYVKDVVLGYYDERGKLCERGRVYFGMSRANNETILRFAANNRAMRPEGFGEDDRVVWLKPFLVGSVRYMAETENGSMRHPVFRGIRDDKPARDCVLTK